ncbi:MULTISPECIES: hypothetical protein [Streptomyces]|uniref:Uncharacterized protein n=1 Tax=Streptomyces koelreuteriae TaxID=2838015 RepID=A0ABX8FLM3_9ACTN|nr:MULTISPECIES: hypothetical protein [Streptomyces]QWB21939.1 hypothetical protein KJK29_04765 [Streptomyces koelreuteriae]UUA04871.1 hypothetical protein NNW98_04790 [Streptomyces koelreuteriae]UUA12495.1 hypothetical protein NNW99_04790 [Streptomyces sp. CRCS-T-1]
MEPLFRLALLRPAIAQDPDDAGIELAQQTDFQRALTAAAGAADPRTELRRVVGEYVAGPLFVGRPEQAPLAKETARFMAGLDRLPAPTRAVVDTRPGAAAPHPPSLRDTVIAAVRDAFGAAPAEVVQGAPYKDAVARLRDSVLAVKYLPAEHTRPLEELVRRLRHLEIVARLVTHTAFPAAARDLRRARRRPVRLPGATGLEPVLSTVEAERRRREKEAEAAGERRQRAERLLTVFRQLRTAIGELTGLGGEHFSVSPQNRSDQVLPPPEYTPPAELARQITFHSQLSAANLRALAGGGGGGGGTGGGAGTGGFTGGGADTGRAAGGGSGGVLGEAGPEAQGGTTGSGTGTSRATDAGAGTSRAAGSGSRGAHGETGPETEDGTTGSGTGTSRATDAGAGTSRAAGSGSRGAHGETGPETEGGTTGSGTGTSRAAGSGSRGAIGEAGPEAQGGAGRAAVEEPVPSPPEPTAVAGAAQLAGQVFGATPDLLAGTPGFVPALLEDLGFRLLPGAVQQLSEATRALLTARGIDVTATPLDRVVALLQSEADGTAAELEKLFGRPARRSVRRLGDTLVTTSTPVPSVWNAISIGDLDPVEQIPLEADPIPTTQGSVKPSGVADLLVVRQQLTGYEGADVAHIENVLKGETKQREHIRREETEQTTVTETETITSEERELESTDRFEMSREASAVIKEDAALKAGLTVTGKYGPTVEFSASAEGSVSRSKEEATKSASTFSQDVTQRSASKISERVLQRTTLRITTEVTEKNTHTLDNSPGIDHISGVYQWVNKVYRAQMFNYGLRTMFDFMIPEPAAFLIHTLQSAHAGAVQVDKPPAFTLQANKIDETNYHYWVQVYQATDVTPPPEMYVTRSFDFKAGGGDSRTNYNHSGQVTLDEGYQAFQASVARLCNIWEGTYSLDVAVGRRTHRFGPEDGWVWITMLDEEQGSIPVAVDSFRLSQVAVGIEIKCRRTERAMEKWRAETHAKLTTAYRARLAEYEEKLAALTFDAGVAIEGRNPLANQELIAHELRKSCVSILTRQHFDLFDAMKGGAGQVPQLDVDEAAAEGAYVRFFEQAFEWEHLTWVAYPYFWGRKSEWDERLAYDDPDPLFNQFLKAGYCRVTVPARLGFEGAVDHFMQFGELWQGGPLPAVSSPLYLPIAEEIAERLDRPGDEIPQGDPWTVRIPTSLVRLREDDRLPRWVQNSEGEWVED